MNKIISLYRDAVRDDWDKQTDATLANMQEAEQNLLSRLSAGEEAVKKVEELKSMSTVEMMCENESVRQHVTEWETRCFKTEAELSDLHTRYVALCALCGTYKSEVAELEKELFDIKSKTFCAYCGFEIAIDNDAPLKIEAHIFECEKHPVCILSKKVAELRQQAASGQRAVEAMDKIIKCMDNNWLDGMVVIIQEYKEAL